MKKAGYLKDSIAKADGYFTAKGEKLKGAKLTQEQQDAWNGVVKKEAPKKAKKVKEEVEVEVSEDE
jgi:hypothetical protein